MFSEVVLVNVSRLTNQIQFPIGLSVIANTLLKHGIPPSVIDLIPVPLTERERYFETRLPAQPAIYGFGLMIGGHHLDEVEKYTRIIRAKSPGSIIVYGGSLPSSIPEMILERSLCDYVIHGEGERSFPALIQALRSGTPAPENIPGVFFKRDGKGAGTPNKRIVKLSELSNPDFSRFNLPYYINYLKETGQSWELMASRGCRGDCSFCYKFMGRGLSLRAIDFVLDEIEYIVREFGLTRFYFVDENFLESRKYFADFIDKKRQRGLEFTFIAQSRIDTIDEQLLKTGRDNGLICISTGAESASQDTLDRINKRISVKDIEDKLALMRQYQIRPSVNFIIGFPWETEQDYLELINFIERNQLQGATKLSYLTPLPATRDFQSAIDKGYIPDEFDYIRNLDNLYWKRQVNLTSLPDEVLDHYYARITDLGKRTAVTPTSAEYWQQIRELH